MIRQLYTGTKFTLFGGSTLPLFVGSKTIPRLTVFDVSSRPRSPLLRGSATQELGYVHSEPSVVPLCDVIPNLSRVLSGLT